VHYKVFPVQHLHEEAAKEPFASVHIDTLVFGDFRLLCLKDVATKFVAFYELQDGSALSSAFALAAWISEFGAPKAIHSDCGSEFANALWDILCKKLAIIPTSSLPFYSRSNGFVERSHKELLKLVRTCLLDFPDIPFRHFIPLMRIMANMISNNPITPFETVYGRKPPLLTALSAYAAVLPEPLLSRFQRSSDQVLPLSHDDLIDPASVFLVDSLVLKLKLPRHKTDQYWLGPFRVVAMPSPHVRIIMDVLTDKQSRIHVGQLKNFYTNLTWPADAKPLQALRAADSTEYLVDLISQVKGVGQGRQALVHWTAIDGLVWPPSWMPVSDISHLDAWKAYLRNKKKNT